MYCRQQQQLQIVYKSSQQLPEKNTKQKDKQRFNDDFICQISLLFTLQLCIIQQNLLNSLYQYKLISQFFIIVIKFRLESNSQTLSIPQKIMFEDIELIPSNLVQKKVQSNLNASRSIHQPTQEIIMQRIYRQSLENQAKKIHSKNQGLSNRFMKLIKNMKMGKSSQACSVCISSFAQDQVIKRLPCKHIFHRQCAKSWLKINRTCPICRLDLQKHYEELQKLETLGQTN